MREQHRDVWRRTRGRECEGVALERDPDPVHEMAKAAANSGQTRAAPGLSWADTVPTEPHGVTRDERRRPGLTHKEFANFFGTDSKPRLRAVAVYSSITSWLPLDVLPLDEGGVVPLCEPTVLDVSDTGGRPEPDPDEPEDPNCSLSCTRHTSQRERGAPHAPAPA